VMSQAVTAGEHLLGRPLRSELRGGVPHFVPGQLTAIVEPYGVPGVLAGAVDYVDAMGHACRVLCVRAIEPGVADEDGRTLSQSWQPVLSARAGQYRIQTPRAVPPDFEFADHHRAALEAAEQRHRRTG
jgi:hypothetical protein